MMLTKRLGLTALAAKSVFLPSPSFSPFLLWCARLSNACREARNSHLPPPSPAACLSGLLLPGVPWERATETRSLFGTGRGNGEQGRNGHREETATASRETGRMHGSAAECAASFLPILCDRSPHFSTFLKPGFPSSRLPISRTVSTSAQGPPLTSRTATATLGCGDKSTKTGSTASAAESPVADEVDRSFVRRLSEAGGANILDGKAFRLVDVREPAELQTLGCIPGAVNIPLSRLAEAFKMHPKCFEKEFHCPKPDTDVTLVVYCQRGVRSAKGCEILAHLGFQALNYRGSYSDWSAPLEAERSDLPTGSDPNRCPGARN
uniref:Rhodanese domain protein, putative n=1 Tax=Neospora caninum (strain Liverpool) TaxID=572307 RepID=A0A0F7UJB8_NEOCL|nr:TPA: Rhodanese domain protein, putative [Neospora caninum Liverpool]